MSLESFNNFLASNPEVLEKVKACSDNAEILEIASQKGFSISAGDMLKAFKHAEAIVELDDEELDAVAGGFGNYQYQPTKSSLFNWPWD